MADSHSPKRQSTSAPTGGTGDLQPLSVPIVSFVAPSGTGKTSLVTEVIRRLTLQGIRVGAIKHDAHRIELDTEGKDSWRLREAGASETLLVGANQLAWMSSREEGPTLQELLPLMEHRVDIILVEGFRSAGLPSVIVRRPETDDPTWEPPRAAEILATVHPSEVDRVIEILASTYGIAS